MTTDQPVRPHRALPAARAWLATIAVGVVLSTTVWAWAILTGITVGEGAWIPPTVLPQVNQMDLTGIDEPLTVGIVPLPIRLLSVAALLVTSIPAVLALWWSRDILSRIGDGDPFHADVPRILRRITAVLISGALVRPALDVAVIALLVPWWHAWLDSRTGGFQSAGLGTALPHFPLTLFTVGVVAGCLVLAFRVGARLREDAVGVV